jgi:hypothetical protein
MSNILRNDSDNTPNPLTLWRSLKTANFKSRIKLAEDKRTPTAVLGVLSYDCDNRIRAAVADNQNTPYMSLIRLARDEADDIRYQLAENHNLPLQVLLVLESDENPYVRVRAQRTLERIQIDSEKARTRLPLGDNATFVSMYRPDNTSPTR